MSQDTLDAIEGYIAQHIKPEQQAEILAQLIDMAGHAKMLSHLSHLYEDVGKIDLSFESWESNPYYDQGKYHATNVARNRILKLIEQKMEIARKGTQFESKQST